MSRLVHAEPFPRRDEAKARETRLKRWNRTWKMGLIEETNPDWDDLYLSVNEWYPEDAR